MTRREPDGLTTRVAELGRLPLYLLVICLLGVLGIPLVLANRRMGRGEKIFLSAMGALQTLAAVALLVLFLFWMILLLKRAYNGEPVDPFSL